MESRTITISDLAKGNIESNVAYTIIRDKSIRERFNDWLKTKHMDRYSRMVRRDFRMGESNDLSYNDTLDKCDDKQYIRMFHVEGYSYFMELKNEEINKNVEYKVKKLINDNKVGYVDDDGFGCYLCCRTEDYRDICKYLHIEYDTRDDDKEFYYNCLFDDIRMWFNDYGELPESISRKAIYDVVRYILVNMDKYYEIILSAREWNEDDVDNFWVNRLWNRAYSDMRNR